MKSHPLTRKHWHMVALGAVALGLLFTFPFLSIVTFAALIAFLFHGLYDRLHKKMQSWIAATLTIIISIFVIIIPIAFTITLAGVQIAQLATSLTGVVSEGTVANNLKDIVHSTNAALSPIVGNGSAFSADSVRGFLGSTLPGVLRGMAGFVGGMIGNIPVMVVFTIMYLIFLYEFLVNGRKIVRLITALSPFQPDITRLYLKRVGLMANAMAKGQLYISFIISVLSSLVLSVFLGLGDYFFLMTVIFTLLNLVPLGCGILVIPITVVAMFSGLLWQGIVAFGLYMIISNLDAAIRPRIIPRSITLSPGLTMLAAFGGISMFGVLGVVYGPILMIILVTAVQLYLDDYKATPAPKST